MAEDPGDDGKTEFARFAQVIGVMVAAIGGVAASAQLVESILSGKLNYIISAAFALMAIVGITVLLTIYKRLTPLVHAAVISATLIFIFAAVFFVITSGYLPLFPAGDPKDPPSGSLPSGTVTTPEVSPPNSTPPTSASPPPSVPPDVPPTWTTRPPAVQPSANVHRNDPSLPSLSSTTPIPHEVTRGTFTSPTNGQNINGQNLAAAGNVEGISSALLCIVKDESGNHFPYNAAQSANGRWNAEVGIGPPSINRRLTFTLILATATRSAVDEIRSRQQNDPNYNEKGLGPNLPSGIEELAEVGVVRTS